MLTNSGDRIPTLVGRLGSPAASWRTALLIGMLLAVGYATAQQPAAPAATETPATETAATDAAPLPTADAAEEAEANGPAAAAPAQDPTAAPAAGPAADSTLRTILLFVLVVAIIAIPFWLGGVLAKSIRTPEMGWRIGLALFTTVGAACIVYQAFNVPEGEPPKIKLGPDLAGGINLIYELAEDQTAFVKEPGQGTTAQQGSPVDRQKLISALSPRINPGGIKEVTIREYGDRQIEIIIPRADRAEVERIKKMIVTAGALEFRITADRSRDSATLIAEAEKEPRKIVELDGRPQAKWVEVDPTDFPDLGTFVTREAADGSLEVLVLLDRYNVTGEFLKSAKPGQDETARPAVLFEFNPKGASLFGRLTTEFRPDASGYQRRLGVVLDDVLKSAPALRTQILGGSGIIEGSFTQEEVDLTVGILDAGSLPAALNDTPISQIETSPLLGTDTIEKGKTSILISLTAVVVFILIYYRIAGIVACVALLVNLLLVVAVMIQCKAAFTLPGLAGLVLTVGMAVDANVLIFERIREELSKGAALRMAIRNGFQRATTTIVDANLTTLFTGIVLYSIATDQIRGFAVVLIIGIVTSMYTAIFCSRLVFDFAEKKRWLKTLSMMQIVGKTEIDFLSWRKLAIPASVLAIVVGLYCVYQRGRGLLDIDFVGGTSITLQFDEQHEVEQVRATLSQPPYVEQLQDVTVVTLGEDGRQFKIDTRNSDLEAVKTALSNAFGGELTRHRLTHTEFAADGAEGGRIRSTLAFSEPIKRSTVEAMADDAIREFNLAGGAFEVLPDDVAIGKEWEFSTDMASAEAERLLNQIQSDLVDAPVFPSANNIGGRVPGDTKRLACYALLASLVIIVGYIWLRFQRIAFGLAAVVALVHDVLVTLGAIAASAFISQQLSGLAEPLLIDPFKISLPILAAFMTIVGYSLNDTIVVFDRIREVRGKSPDITAKMINTSINQTLSRTLLTSLTTLIVVIILYVAGGPGIHGFAFALVIGVAVGTYSSIFIASPCLLWMGRFGDGAAQPASRQPAGEPAAVGE